MVTWSPRLIFHYHDPFSIDMFIYYLINIKKSKIFDKYSISNDYTFLNIEFSIKHLYDFDFPLTFKYLFSVVKTNKINKKGGSDVKSFTMLIIYISHMDLMAK
jgi:hypothetical protein